MTNYELKYELQTIICGTGKVSYGDTIQGATRYLRGSKRTSSQSEGTKYFKNEETARLSLSKWIEAKHHLKLCQSSCLCGSHLWQS